MDVLQIQVQTEEQAEVQRRSASVQVRETENKVQPQQTALCVIACAAGFTHNVAKNILKWI